MRKLRQKKLKNNQKRGGKKTATSGFTLVEMLVSLSIMGLLLGTGIARYQEFNRTQVLKAAAANVIISLRGAQNKALTGLKDSIICEGNALTGWEVEFGQTGSFWGIDGIYDSECKFSFADQTDVYATCTTLTCPGTSCWSSDGSVCDFGCNRSSVEQSTVYANCSSSPCAESNCWSTDYAHCDLGCNSNQKNLVTVSSECVSEPCATYAWKYNGQICNYPFYEMVYSNNNCQAFLGYAPNQCSALPSSCSEPSYWPYQCFALTNGRGPYLSRSTNQLPCYFGSCRNDANPTQRMVYDLHACAWTCNTYCSGEKRWYIGSATFKYALGSACNPSGSGLCYKLTNAGTYNFAMGQFGLSANCGSDGCSSAIYYGNAQTCSWMAQKYTTTVSDQVARYTGSGSCDGNGNGDCYKLTNPAGYYTTGYICGFANCAANTYYGSYTACSFLSALYSYEVSDQVIKWSGTGSCSIDGLGQCFKLTNPQEYFTTGSACGGSSCSNGSFYDSQTECTFYESEGPENGYRIKGLCGTTEFMEETYQIFANNNIVITTAPEKVTFKPVPSFGVIGLEEGGNICLAGFNKFYKLSISPSGKIEDIGFVESCP